MKTWVIATVLLSALAATPALAQQASSSAPRNPPMPPAGAMRGPGRMGGGAAMLRMADANGDGVVTRAEYVAAIDRRFDRMDANHDGILTPDEMPMRGGGGGRGRMRADAPSAPPANGSSAATPPAPMPSRPGVTRDQYRAGAMRRFDRLDANRDGQIDQAEMTAAEAMRAGRGGGMGEAPPAGQ